MMVVGKMIQTDVEESDEAGSNMQCNGLPVRTVKIPCGVVIPFKIL
jgi:hypothetical protein